VEDAGGVVGVRMINWRTGNEVQEDKKINDRT
jgi:hypothetical protein